MDKKKLLLIAEDDVSIRTILSTELESKYDLKLTDNCSQLWSWVSDGIGDLIILDVVMPDENGLDLIPKIKEIRPDIKIIVVSAQNTILTAMQAVEKGAYEYLAKPFDLTELNKIINTALPDESNTGNSYSLKSNENKEIPIIGSSPLMQKVFKSVAKLVNTDLIVMIFGESGTGKELVAKVLHDHGKRKNGPFIAINMAAIPKELIESESSRFI